MRIKLKDLKRITKQAEKVFKKDKTLQCYVIPLEDFILEVFR